MLSAIHFFLKELFRTFKFCALRRFAQFCALAVLAEHLGAQVKLDKNTLHIKSSSIAAHSPPLKFDNTGTR